MVRREDRRNRRELIKELKNKREYISVEITNISYARCYYIEEQTNFKYFDLKTGESAIIDLVELQEVVNKCRFMFSEHYLLVTDVILGEEVNKKYTIDDILNFVGLMDIYVDLEDHTIDYIEEIIYEYDTKEFERMIDKADKSLLLSIAGRMLSDYKNDPYEVDRSKIDIISSKLGIRDLFEENWM